MKTYRLMTNHRGKKAGTVLELSDKDAAAYGDLITELKSRPAKAAAKAAAPAEEKEK